MLKYSTPQTTRSHIDMSRPHQILSEALPDVALTAQHDVHRDSDFVERTDGRA